MLGIQTRTFQMMSAQRAFQGPEVSLPDNKIETNTATSGITEDEALQDSQSSAKEYVSSTVLDSERHYDVAGAHHEPRGSSGETPRPLQRSS